MRERHSRVLQRLVKAIPETQGECYVEQRVADSLGDLHPDIVVMNRSERTAVIVDVTIPFESSQAALDTARAEKLRKYRPLADWMQSSLGLKTSVSAFVVGLLGSWDSNNCSTLRTLGIGKRYENSSTSSVYPTPLQAPGLYGLSDHAVVRPENCSYICI